MNKASVFIGSSSEGLPFAQAIRSLLVDDAEVTLWKEGFSKLGETFIETLANALPRFDFAILVLTPDDLVNSRNTEKLGPRDNVIFELGLFMGRLGRSRTILVHQSDESLKIPSDLSGVCTATFEWPRVDKSHKGAVGVACDSIREVIRDLGFSETKVGRKIQIVEQEQQRQKQEIDTLSFLISHFLPGFELIHLQKLSSSEPFLYDMNPSFEQELRHLWQLNFISKKTDFRISKMSAHGDLKNYFTLSDHGRIYLEIRKSAETKMISNEQLESGTQPPGSISTDSEGHYISFSKT